GFNLVMSAVHDNRRLIGVVMGGDSAWQRDRLMAELMDRGFATAQAMRLSAWTTMRKPASARYTAGNFDPALVLPPSAPRLATAQAPATAEPAAQAASFDQRTAAAGVPAEGSAPPAGATIGSWVIQLG